MIHAYKVRCVNYTFLIYEFIKRTTDMYLLCSIKAHIAYYIGILQYCSVHSILFETVT